MIRIRKPDESPLINVLGIMLNKAFKPTQNVTIDVNPDYQEIDTNNRIQRKEVGNPNVLYIYWGYDTYRQVPAWQGYKVPNKSEVLSIKAYETDEIAIMHSRPQNEFKLVGEYKDFAYAVGNTVWIMTPTISQRLLNNIAKYAVNPVEYVKQKTIEGIRKSYKTVLEEKYKAVEVNLIKTRRDLDKLQKEQSECFAKIETYELDLFSINKYLEDFYTYFDTKMKNLTNNPIVNSVWFDADVGSINVRTNTLIAYGTGDFNIEIAPLTIVVMKDSYYFKDAEKLYPGYGGDMPHPHLITRVNINQQTAFKACLGSIESDLLTALAKQDLFTAMDLLIQFLQQYNNNDLAGKRYYSWPKAL